MTHQHSADDFGQPKHLQEVDRIVTHIDGVYEQAERLVDRLEALAKQNHQLLVQNEHNIVKIMGLQQQILTLLGVDEPAEKRDKPEE